MVLGIDIGSASTKAVLCNDGLEPLGSLEERNRGEPGRAFETVVSRLLDGRSPEALRIGVTGVGRSLLRTSPDLFLANEVVALAHGAARFLPGARSVIDIGAQSSRWILLSGPAAGASSEPEIIDFALSDVCAAGSGAFLEQQAARLKLSVEELACLAAAAKRGATIAGRCSVFAKTDMIHLQQKGTPLEEIAYGLCLALARNFAATVLKGREPHPPVVLAGGGSRNPGLVAAFQEVLGLESFLDRCPLPPHFLASLGAAAGAAVHARPTSLASPAHLLATGASSRPVRAARRQPLGALEVRPSIEPRPEPSEPVRGFLGVDIGSVSTNLVLLDGSLQVKAGVYLPTKGRPLEVLREGFAELRTICPAGLEILGVGTTGSGRHLAGAVLRADVVHNEITCQLRSASLYVPDVDTIFEIGGQDSKYISLRDGRMEDFTMNKICAAGTGSFLEEQAETLGLRIEDEFSRLAASSLAPEDLGSRCTVFMESELADALGRGVPVSDIAAGLAYSIVRNYLEKVVAGRPIGRTIVFQGGVASNPAVVRAFSLELGREVKVHPYNRISGAIGAALMAKEGVERGGRRSPDTEALAARLDQPSRVESFTCRHCSNRCQVNRIAFGDEILYFGDTCERYTALQGARQPSLPSSVETEAPDLFAERAALAEAFLRAPAAPRLRFGLPRASIFHEFLPFWATFLQELGAEVVLSPSSGPDFSGAKTGAVPAETCLPIKTAFDHLAWFSGRGLDAILFPSIIDLHQDPRESVSLCPFTENFPFMARAVGRLEILAPSVCVNGTIEDFLASLGELREVLGSPEPALRSAYEAARSAQESFAQRLKERGREVLEAFRDGRRPVWVVIGRPYTLHDRYLNLNLPRHLAKLGVVAVPVDFLPLDGSRARDWPGTPPWRYNRQAVEAALWCLDRPEVDPVILTNFGCGLDAFNLRHLQAILGRRPHLVLEFDEHRAEAGLITRLEAFLDEVREPRPESRPPAARPKVPSAAPRPFEEYRGRRFVLPYFADHVHAFAGAFRAAGLDVSVLPLPDEETVALGERHSTGKECHAYAIIAGDFVKLARSKRRGGEVFYFPGTKYACVLNQYDKGLNYLAAELGFTDIEALAPSVAFLNEMLGLRGLRLLWQGLVAIDLLVKASCAIRPYEVEKGSTDRAHAANLADIEAGLAAGDIGPALKRAADRLRAIARRHERRPVVGIAGDVYTRINPVANHDLFLRLEELGCEVRPASFFVDDVDFDLGRTLRRKMARRKYGESAAAALLTLRKEFERMKVRKSLESAVPLRKDPSFAEIARLSSPYIGLDNNQVLILNVAKMAEFASQGADGVINAICFNCMLGTAAGAIAEKVRRDYDHIPIPTFIFTGSELASERTKLEAFVYQIKQRCGRRKGRRPS